MPPEEQVTRSMPRSRKARDSVTVSSMSHAPPSPSTADTRKHRFVGGLFLPDRLGDFQRHPHAALQVAAPGVGAPVGQGDRN